jgi:hypothetical protein
MCTFDCKNLLCCFPLRPHGGRGGVDEAGRFFAKLTDCIFFPKVKKENTGAVTEENTFLASVTNLQFHYFPFFTFLKGNKIVFSYQELPSIYLFVHYTNNEGFNS